MKTTTAPLPPPSLADLRFQYQPIAPLRDGVDGWHEALVRWQLPDGTIRGPLDVLPYWLAPPRQATFTRFTIERAADLLGSADGARLSINLSPRQLTDPSTVALFEDLLPNVRGRLIVELTEQRHRDVAGLRASLEALTGRCQLVLLDDVTVDDLERRSRAGTPVDGIKLDRSVLAALQDPGRSAAIAARVREVATRYPIVVAEGLEERALAAWLDELGVTHVQGFGFGRPAPRPGAPPAPVRPGGRLAFERPPPTPGAGERRGARADASTDPH